MYVASKNYLENKFMSIYYTIPGSSLEIYRLFASFLSASIKRMRANRSNTERSDLCSELCPTTTSAAILTFVWLLSFTLKFIM